MSDATLTEWARLLFGTLLRAGVTQAVVSPGSRSTPFTWAALHTEGMHCHSVCDERSAGFFALGQARISGRPSVLICTSGSAAAQYFPAVVEASQANIPLLVLSADRPFELMDCGAAQCMDQVELYGKFSRSYVELGHAERSSTALDGLTRKLAQAVTASLGPRPGPVHINARARKPLEPMSAQSAEDLALSREVDARLERGPTRSFVASMAPAPAALEAVANACRNARSGLIVCGPLAARSADPSALFQLARITGFPLCLETTSQARLRLPSPLPSDLVVLGSFDALLSSRCAASFTPEVVLVLGGPPTSASFERWRGTSAASQAVVSDGGWLDPSNRARWVIDAAPSAFAAALAARLAEPAGLASSQERQIFTERCRRAERIYWQITEEELAAAPHDELSEPKAVRAALTLLPQAGLLGLGNSLPIRSVDAFVPPRPGATEVWCQRGVNGIDGLVSGAVGAAQAAGVPSLALLGDVSLLHDLGGLAAARGLRSSLVLLVLDNGGGRIFDELPVQAALAAEPSLTNFWLTPPNLDFRHAAALFELRYARVEQESSLESALDAAFQHPGCTLIHAIVGKNSVRETRARIRTRLDEALSRQLT